MLLRCLRAALLVSHGVRRDTVVYLVLLGGPSAPRTLRVSGAAVRFLRPDERSLAVTAQKALAEPVEGEGFIEVRPGIAVAAGGLAAVIDDVATAAPGSLYIVEEGAPDIRGAPLDRPSPVFFFGDHIGFHEASRARLVALGAASIGLGPVSVHADDAVVLVAHELDRRGAQAAGRGRS